MLSVKERLRNVKHACSRTIQTSGANRFVRRAHHRRCAREGLLGCYDALHGPSVASLEGWWSFFGYGTYYRSVIYVRWEYMSDRHSNMITNLLRSVLMH